LLAHYVHVTAPAYAAAALAALAAGQTWLKLAGVDGASADGNRIVAAPEHVRAGVCGSDRVASS
jgi:hypothetical protein